MANENYKAMVCVVSVDLMIPMSHSLKDKRKQVKSLKDKIRNRFNASVAEIDYLDDWQRSTLGVSMIGNDKQFLEKQYRAIENLLLENRETELLNINIEWL